MKQDLTGRRFGRLVVLKETDLRSSDSHIIWECVCDCGTIKNVVGKSLRGGQTKSCGCLQKETFREIATLNRDSNSLKIRKSFTVEGMKNCTVCLNIKPVEEFDNNKRSSDGKLSRCKECSYFDHIRNEYNISRTDFLNILKNQNSICPICEDELVIYKSSEKIRKIAVDHDHETLKIRGIVHFDCNLNLIGSNSLQTARRLVDYLSKTNLTT